MTDSLRKIVILGHSNSVHVIRWAKGLAASGLDVHVLSCGGKEIEGIRTSIYGGKSGALNYFRYIYNVRREINGIKPSLIHAFQVTGYGHWGASKVDCPKILTALGSDVIITGQRSFLHKTYVRSICGKYDYVTAASKYLKTQIERICPMSAGKVKVVPFGVEIPVNFKEHLLRVPMRLIYLKHFLRVYGPDILIRAMSILKQNKVKVQLDMYGLGREEVDLKRLTVELGVSDCISFKGWLDPKQVSGKLLEYDIMVMPSRSESFGVAAVEALASGIPVIASHVGGIPEIIINSQTGVLVEPDNPEALSKAIMNLSSDADLRNKMARAGREHVSKYFRWKDNLGQMLNIYDMLLAGKK